MGSPFAALHMARMAKRLTPNVTIYTDGAEDLAQKTAEAAVDDDIKVESRRITLLERGAVESSVVVHFGDGQRITEGFLVSSLKAQCRPNTKSNGPTCSMLMMVIGAQA